jgi:hypothetical protein
MRNFNTDLAWGQLAEKGIAAFFQLDGMITDVKHTSGPCDYDFSGFSTKTGEEVKFELKTDFKAHSTGNLCFEVLYKGKPSGVSTTSADVFLYFLPHYEDGDNLFIFAIDKLKEMLLQGIGRKVMGGDDNKSGLILVPIGVATQFCSTMKIDKSWM